jgi:hypothetical protein
MHCWVWSQQSLLVVHLSSVPAHPIGVLHLPLEQKPPQQSTPLVQPPPFILQGLSVANARMLPEPSSWPGR